MLLARWEFPDKLASGWRGMGSLRLRFQGRLFDCPGGQAYGFRVKDHEYFVYVVCSRSGTLYIGMTNSICRRAL